MSDLFAAIKESEPYKALLSAFASSRAPHAILAQSPALFHEALAVEIARLYLARTVPATMIVPPVSAGREGNIQTSYVPSSGIGHRV